jgi:hypothetical protein
LIWRSACVNLGSRLGVLGLQNTQLEGASRAFASLICVT